MVQNGPATSTQFGFVAQDVMSVLPNLVSRDVNTGYYKLDYQGLIAPIVKAIQVITTRLAALEQIVAGFADSFTTKELTFTRATGDELTVKKMHTQELCAQKSDGTEVCVSGDQLAAVLASQGSNGTSSSSPANSASSTPDTTPPVITINGDNPAHIHVGDTYSDLGATVTDNVDHNLGVKTFLNGALVSNIVLDTSTSTTDTIDYVATDQAGNIATSTRTVLVEPIN